MISILHIKKFQFQYGSIKSDEEMQHSKIEFLFQFQYGSIKRIFLHQQGALQLAYFNSNMVRLKADYDIAVISEQANFNSNMVRLKDPNMFRVPYVLFGFQFQYGSIKSFIEDSHGIMNNVFQFQYGSIKSRLAIIVADRFINFNSNMVRLKGLISLERFTITFISIPIWFD